MIKPNKRIGIWRQENCRRSQERQVNNFLHKSWLDTIRIMHDEKKREPFFKKKKGIWPGTMMKNVAAATGQEN